MLGRRQIREKILQNLYGYNIGRNSIEYVEKRMFQSIEEIYDLYIYELNLLLAVKEHAVEVIERKKQKRFATEEEKNPNLKFVDNKIFTLLENNKARKEYSEKHLELSWHLNNNYPAMIFNKLQASRSYNEYMTSEESNFQLDQKIILKLFLKYIADSDLMYEWFEELKLSWADDMHIANNMTLKTLKSIEEGREFNTLIQVLKSEEDITFTKNLFRSTVEHYQESLKLIEERSNNWELDRIAEIDKIILTMGFTELNYFPEVPAKVVINECIELAKIYSSSKSNVFINGILDRFARETNRV